VDERSGILVGHAHYGLALDHFELNKFPTPNGYFRQVVREVITVSEYNKPKCTTSAS
jgi:hypothetical protein